MRHTDPDSFLSGVTSCLSPPRSLRLAIPTHRSLIVACFQGRVKHATAIESVLYLIRLFVDDDRIIDTDWDLFLGCGRGLLTPFLAQNDEMLLPDPAETIRRIILVLG